MTVIALDPGTRCGWAYGFTPGQYGCEDLSPAKGKKARPAKGERPAVPGVPAEPEYARCGKIGGLLMHITPAHIAGRLTVVAEGAAAFIRGKAAVKVSHELRGAVKSWCWTYRARYVEVQPADLKRWATGKTTAEKHEMIAAARARYGYTGDCDDEADALLLLGWAKEHLPEVVREVAV